ncbi:MAG: hypothetical protein A4E19_19825 [Nitrospira sp. SG-bin1]|nr:MAG: hypothetical protein A4E19_19825 [Nitrospira sp. SG-bin1]
MRGFLLALWLVGGLAACQGTQSNAAVQTMHDASVTAAVQKNLTADRRANFARVDVDTEQGIVRLSGTVQTSEHRIRAEELAKQVSGVRRVDNHLQVQTAQRHNGKEPDKQPD